MSYFTVMSMAPIWQHEPNNRGELDLAGVHKTEYTLIYYRGCFFLKVFINVGCFISDKDFYLLFLPPLSCSSVWMPDHTHHAYPLQHQKGDDVLSAALWHKFIPQRHGICCRIKCLYPCKSCVVF